MINSELNITFTQVPDSRAWVIKRWEARCGKVLLGEIIKRYVGKGTPIGPFSKRRLSYQTHVTLISGVGLGIPKGSAQKEDYKSAKKFIIKKWTRLINEMTREEKD